MIVYALSLDGSTHVYVGKTRGAPETRLRKHIANARAGRLAPLHYWIRHQEQLGNDVVITVLESCSNEHELSAAEDRWIEDLRTRGFILLNLKQAVARESRREKIVGNPWEDAEYRERITSTMQSDAYRQKMSALKKGKKLTTWPISCISCRKLTSTMGLGRHRNFCS